jgi:HSP20 family protein
MKLGGNVRHVHRRRRDIDELQSEIQELFADLWQVPRFSGLRRGFRPQVDCYRTENPPEVTVLIELPGVDSDSVELAVGDGTLTVAGKRMRPRCEGLVYQQMELEYGPFRRQVQLPEDVDVAAARASYERGMLKVVLPIAPRRAIAQPVSIEVTRS